MEEAKFRAFKERLLAEKTEIETQVDHMERDYGGMDVSLQDSIEELSFYDNHPADIGSEVFERSKDLALRENLHNHIEKIDEALRRINAGSYGTCQRCGKTIPEARLEAFPATTLCIHCKEKEEELIDRHPRPIEEDVISPPFGGYLHDDQPNSGDSDLLTIYDGEDTWQEVALYGTSETPQDIGGHVMSFRHMYPDFDEDRGFTEDVDAIPYEKDLEGRIYEDLDGKDDEMNASPFPDLIQQVERGRKIYLHRTGKHTVQAEDEAGRIIETDSLPRE